MAKILLYNPENDLALAFGGERFTPPAAAVALARAGALLPFWWAEEGDCVIAPGFEQEATELCKRYGLHGTVGFSATEPMPWGWSLYTRRILINAGVNPEILPSDADIVNMRLLSHRHTATLLHSMLGTPEHLRPVTAATLNDAMHAIRSFNGKAVVKLPWSCSGRGVIFARRLAAIELSRRIEGTLSKQGSVCIEPEYEPIAEMAALYFADGLGNVEWRGMSAFKSGDGGRYEGNIVAPQQEIEQMCGPDALQYAAALQPHLATLIGTKYRGWLGVDMLRHTTGLNPCMELNLRFTMGVAAMYIWQHLGRRGILAVTPTLRPTDIDLSPTGQAPHIVLRPFAHYY